MSTKKAAVMAVIFVAVLLMGMIAQAQDKEGAGDEPLIETASLARPSVKSESPPRSISVYYREHYDLEAEQPFRYTAGPEEAPAALASAYVAAGLRLYPQGVVVENCRMLPAENGSWRHPLSLEERKRAGCEVHGYAAPKMAAAKAKPKKKRKRRG